LACSSIARSQQTDSLRFTKLGIENGLPDSKITAIVQDGAGFLWIGTGNGLSRYDGTEFRNFFQNKKTNSLPGNNIIQIINYDPNHLIIATTTGLSLLNTRTLQFKNFLVNSSASLFSRDNYFTALAIDSNKNIWAGTRTVLYCLSPELKVLKSWRGYGEQDYNKQRMHYVQSICIMPDHEVLLVLEDKITWEGAYYIYNAHADTLQPLQQLKSHPLYLLNRLGTSGNLCIDKKGNPHFLKQSRDSVCDYDLYKKLVHSTRLLTTKYIPKQEMKWENFQILNAGQSTLHSAANLQKEFALLPSSPPHKLGTLIMPAYIRGQTINSTQIDRNGNIWIGSSNGLFTSVARFTNVQSSQINQSGYPIVYLFRMSFIHDAIWVASEPGGFFIFNRQCKQLGNIILKGDPFLATTWFAMPGPSKDTLWLSTQLGMRWYHVPTKTYGTLTIKGKPRAMDEKPVTATFTDSKGLIWLGIGFGNGMVQYNPFNRTMTHYTTSGDTNSMPIRYPMAIAEDAESNLWMGNRDGTGIARWRRKDNRFDMIRTDYYSTFDNAIVNSMLCNRSAQLWVATDNGLFKYYIPTNRITKYDVSNGLPSNALSSITEDDKGRLWIGTTNGLSCFYPDENRFVNFMHPNALPEPGINDLAWDSQSKKIYFVTNQYVNSFDPDSLLAQRPKLTISITNVRIDNTEKAIQTYYNIPYNQNDISFSFTAINFANGPLNKYYYKLAGKQWISLGNQRQVNFLNLSPGHYSFSLKAVNSAGTWSDETTIRFTIRRAWWQTWWFRILALAAMASLIFWLVKRRISNIRHVAEMRQKIAETEMMALRAQMNPHFIFNCINSIDALILSNDKYQATMYLNKFAKLLRNVLDSSKQNTVPLTKDMETLQLYIDLEQLREENKFTARINTEADLLQDDYKVPPLIIQPYVENAILHGLKHRRDNKGQLVITVTKQEEYIRYIIEDNGIGRKASQNGVRKEASYGMQMSQDRVKFFNNEDNASVVVTDLQQDGEATGTRVQVLLKIQ
jgi:ligand-binding sensor domain-containing protein/anti-sigma regulatory factor (Ser/Thr protein kinase)